LTCSHVCDIVTRNSFFLLVVFQATHSKA